MQKELSAEGLPVAIQILGVNGIGLADTNGDMIAGRTLPWLQDVEAENVWTSWKVNYRDVVLLDTQNRRTHIFNLTQNDLSNAGNYATLKDALRAQAVP